MASIREILNYHKMDRRLYERVLGLGRLPTSARNIVALWMWLELMGIDVIRYLQNITASTQLLNFVNEAEAILNVIRQQSPPPSDNEALPFTSHFATEPINLRFFYFHSDVVMRGLTYLLDGVGTIIFNDQLNYMANTYETAVSLARQQGMRPVTMPVELAMQFNSRAVPSSEDHRSLFIAFSKGSTLRMEEITEYFNERLGHCIEKVMVEDTMVGVMRPMYGRVVFESEAPIEILLSGEQMVMFVVKGNNVWGRRYVPSARRS
ncbi:hypothetical protein J5N97_018630 [Dioscorea zingiberensis]|uniref:Uncharacterized protein n=1 Tax=Dioscorea zingiberensis TaxID=325984 RepID=A0A9D5CC87_9LILI|nr:hypothetical protein J5N97_018630 [Dioscorea zingiberensis]